MAKAGVVIGHPCTSCAATMEACDLTIRRSGHGCCPACFDADTHGLLDKFKAREIESLTRRVQELEDVVSGLEKHFGLTRRPRERRET